jgi:nicotinate phosphoribosyltransferase
MSVPSALATDLYQLTMMAGYDAAGYHARTTFELFVRNLPEERSYLVAAGLAQALDYLESLSFTADEIDWLRSLPAFRDVPPRFFLDVLPSFRFTGEVWAVEEGEVVFAREPLIRVTAPALEAQLVETALLATIGFQTSVASKASRVVDAARGRSLVEFGSRRAHGLEAACLAARAANLVGFQGTSNVEAGRRFGIPVVGTMAHSWVMAFDDELEAFRAYMAVFGTATTLLIDTYDTVEAARRIVSAGLRPSTVRLDSGDLGALAREVRAIFDAGGLGATRIFASGDLDEHRIASLLGGGAPIDAFGVGTSVSTVRDAPALGAVYKLVDTEHEGRHVPVIKLSTGKSTLPGLKQVWRRTSDGAATHDVLGLVGETQIGRPLLRCVMRGGKRIGPSRPIEEIVNTARRSREELPARVRAIDRTEPLEVQVTPALQALADTSRARLQENRTTENARTRE